MTEVYEQFARSLKRARDDRVGILEDEEGLISSWAGVCDKLAGSDDVDEELREAYELERNVWDLFQSLYAERLQDPVEPRPTSKYDPPVRQAQQIIEQSPRLTELSILRDWLHSIPSRHTAAEIRRGYKPYTKSKLKQARRTGQSGPRGLVEHLDPDADLREDGASFDTDDVTYERALLRSLFAYVRTGSLDLAIDMCRQSDQSWRAASLSGGQLASDSLLGDDDEDMDMDQQSSGCRNRMLWKATCRRLSEARNIDQYERALYGALAGALEPVLPVCSTWEDHLWASTNALFETSIDEALQSTASIWTGARPIEGQAKEAVEPSLEAIFEKLARGSNQIALQARNPLRVAVAHIVNKRTSELIASFVERLEATATQTEPATVSNLLRFFAHLVIALRMLGQPVPEVQANQVLEAYVKVLESEAVDQEVIAYYASLLSDDSAIESFAQYLLTFGLESTSEERKSALMGAAANGLDVAAIARRTVELIIDDITYEWLDRPLALNIAARLDERETELVRSIEWLSFVDATYPDALQQANALVRFFLCSDLPHAARELLFALPRDVVTSSQQSDDQQQEWLAYEAYFACIESHEQVVQEWDQRPRGTKVDLLTYRDGLEALVDDFYAQAIDLLTSDWLKLDVPDAALTRRAEELRVIRQSLVPHLVLRLQQTLLDTASLIPSSIERALDLSNIVADERLKLYEEFVAPTGNRITEYLDLVRQVALVAVDASGSPFAAK